MQLRQLNNKTSMRLRQLHNKTSMQLRQLDNKTSMQLRQLGNKTSMRLRPLHNKTSMQLRPLHSDPNSQFRCMILSKLGPGLYQSRWWSYSQKFAIHIEYQWIPLTSHKQTTLPLMTCSTPKINRLPHNRTSKSCGSLLYNPLILTRCPYLVQRSEFNVLV